MSLYLEVNIKTACARQVTFNKYYRVSVGATSYNVIVSETDTVFPNVGIALFDY